MGHHAPNVVYPKILVLAVLISLIGGCLPMQMAGEDNILDNKDVSLKQALQEKDSEINKLKEILGDQQEQLRGLSNQLNECRNRK